MYGFEPRAVDYVSQEDELKGKNPITPLFLYLSAGWPDWLKGRIYDELASRFENKFNLPEINPAFADT